MNLSQLKKRLKQQERKTSRNKSRRWFWLLLSLVLIGVSLLPLYRWQQETAPQRLFNEAAKQESLGKIVAAQQLYQQLYKDYPQSELAAEALLQIGKIWQYDRQQDQQALLSYLQLEHDFSSHPLVQTAQASAAHIIKYSLRDYSRAIGFYQRLLERTVGNRDQYLYEIADCYFRLDNYSQAGIELQTLLELHPQSRLLPDVLYRLGGLALLENKPQTAKAFWQRLIDQFSNSRYTIEARFNLAKLLEEDDRLLDALELYQQLQDFPQPALLREKIKHLEQRIAAKKKAI